MCIIAIAHQVSERFPLIVAANRDERHARPTAAADWWHGPGSLLAGRDLEAGGTWLGITGSGRFAAVTNIFEPAAPRADSSRGALVTGFLESSLTPSQYAADVAGARYGPFNLLLRAGDELHFVSNRNSTAPLGAGIHVFSNNSPGMQWSKVDALADAIARAIAREDLAESLILTLSGPDARGTLDRAADSMFVVGPSFGTRCTTVVTTSAGGRVQFVEQRFDASGKAAGCSEFDFESL